MRLLALLNIVALALPAGWCCGVGRPATCCAPAEARVEKSTAGHCPACAARKKARPESDGPGLAPSHAEGCGCAVPPAVAAKWLDLPDAYLPAGEFVPPIVPGGRIAASPLQAAVHNHGPPLYVLHCVWLC